ncbi:MAG: polysaccharide biosynthesis/export family protein [Acidobacteria bacterium]|nr:polysaccharide biosynthesis/export family protein [Acidobacteriota bacterium]
MTKLNTETRRILIPCLLLAAAYALADSAGAGAAKEAKMAASAPASVAVDPNGPTYVIGIEDVIQITVWKNSDLSVIVPVRPDGRISVPLIDDVTAAGLHPLELKDELTRRWKAFLSAPEVSVIVKEVNSFKVYMVGQVSKQGELQLKGPTRLLQAISLAGGLTSFADRSKIVLLRESGGHEIRKEINYKRVISGKDADDNVLLERGDTVYVP